VLTLGNIIIKTEEDVHKIVELSERAI